MTAERAQRRLAAILAADIVGYSRMMGADEAMLTDRGRIGFELVRGNALRHKALLLQQLSQTEPSLLPTKAHLPLLLMSAVESGRRSGGGMSHYLIAPARLPADST